MLLFQNPQLFCFLFWNNFFKLLIRFVKNHCIEKFIFKFNFSLFFLSIFIVFKSYEGIVRYVDTSLILFTILFNLILLVLGTVFLGFSQYLISIVFRLIIFFLSCVFLFPSFMVW